eukprot:2967396-Rhodomonas_salina.1
MRKLFRALKWFCDAAVTTIMLCVHPSAVLIRGEFESNAVWPTTESSLTTSVLPIFRENSASGSRFSSVLVRSLPVRTAPLQVIVELASICLQRPDMHGQIHRFREISHVNE